MGHGRQTEDDAGIEEDELTGLVPGDTGVVTVVVNNILRVLLAVSSGADSNKAAPSGRNQDNRGNYRRSATATATLIATIIDALEGDLETKLGLIRSFLCMASVAVGNETTETPTRRCRCRCRCQVSLLAAIKALTSSPVIRPRIGTARTTNSVGAFVGQRARHE
jgi:hypothetical protein